MTIITLLNYHLDLRSICMRFFSSPHHREISVIIWELDLKGVKRICRFPLHIPLKSVSLKRPAKTVCTSPNSIKAFLTAIFETVVGRYIVTKIVLESSLVPWRPWPLFEQSLGRIRKVKISFWICSQVYFMRVYSLLFFTR